MSADKHRSMMNVCKRAMIKNSQTLALYPQKITTHTFQQKGDETIHSQYADKNPKANQTEKNM